MQALSALNQPDARAAAAILIATMKVARSLNPADADALCQFDGISSLNTDDTMPKWQ